MKIGYQGTKYSYNYKAAVSFAERLNLGNDYELIPLRNTLNVVNALNAMEIDYGVAAIQNSLAGIVTESFKALETESFELVDTQVNQINHCFFIRKDISPEDVKSIASHEMALKQCKKFIEKKYPNAELKPTGDTALSATLLSEGGLSKNTGVLCSKEAGLDCDLQLVNENVQDDLENFTEFRMFKVREVDDSISWFNKILLLFYSDEKPELVFKIIYVALIFGLFKCYDYYYQNMNSLGAAWLLGGALSSLLVIISNKRLRNKFYFSFIKGYWVYQRVSDYKDYDSKQLSAIPRIAEIYEENGKLKFSIYIADKSAREFARSTNTLHSKFGEKTGQIVYWYEVSDRRTARFNFKGIVYMSWQNKEAWKKITHLTARYLGEETKDHGHVNYYRVTKEEFDRIKSCEFLDLNVDYMQMRKNN